MQKTFEFVKIPTGFKFSGKLDETLKGDDLLASVAACHNLKFIEFDFGAVERASSVGIVAWVRFLGRMFRPYCYSNVPPWLVQHLNSISAFLKPGAGFVSSVYVPFYCEAEDTEERVLFNVGKDIPLQSPSPMIKIPEREINGKLFVADCDTKHYFQFLQINQQLFQQFMAPSLKADGGHGSS